MSFASQHILSVSKPFFADLIGESNEIIFCEGQATYTFDNNVPTRISEDIVTKDALDHELLHLSAEVYEEFLSKPHNEYSAFVFETDNGTFLGVYFFEASKVCAVFRRDPNNYVESENDIHLHELAAAAERIAV